MVRSWAYYCKCTLVWWLSAEVNGTVQYAVVPALGWLSLAVQKALLTNQSGLVYRFALFTLVPYATASAKDHKQAIGNECDAYSSC